MAVAAGAPAAEPRQAILADGPSFAADLVGADGPTWKLRFAAGEAQREIAAGELVKWGAFGEPARGVQVALADGGLIALESVKIDKDHLRGQSEIFAAFALPLELIAGVVYRPPLDPASADRLLARINATGGETDRVLLDNGDELTGTVTGMTDEVLRLDATTGPVDVPLKKITAVIFNPALLHRSSSKGLRAWVGLRNGSRVLASALDAKKEMAQVQLAGGGELKAPTDTITALQPLGGRAVYLSDLTPSSYKHIPFLQMSWPYQIDRSVLGRNLRAGTQTALKGLGMHSPSRITYDLDGSYRRFQADVAIDAESGSRGSVIVRVFTDDGSGAWQDKAASEIVRGGAPAVPISVDLTGVNRLSLLVDFADRGDELDHVDWLDARLIR